MLPWWGWVLLWAVLVLGGALLVGLRARATWRSLKSLTAELGRAGSLLVELEEAVATHRELAQPVPAVLEDPHRLREEHRRRREARVAERTARRAERTPPWARHVH